MAYEECWNCFGVGVADGGLCLMCMGDGQLELPPPPSAQRQFLINEYRACHARGEGAEPAQAAQRLTELMPAYVAEFGQFGQCTLDVRRLIAVFTYYDGQYAKARQMLTDLIPDLERHLRPGHDITGTAHRFRAACRGAQGDPAGAVQELDELIADLLRLCGPHNSETREAQRVRAFWAARVPAEAPRLRPLTAEDMGVGSPNQEPDDGGWKQRFMHWLRS